MPTMDIKQGFHQVAKFNYFPGWHQQVSVSEVLMNKKAFDALPKSWKKIVEVAAGNQVHYTYAESEAMQFDAMAEMRDKHKVQIKRWTDEQIASFEKAWLEVIAEESAKDPLFKKIPTTTSSSARSTRSEAQTMKPTYLPQGQAGGEALAGAQTFRRPGLPGLFVRMRVLVRIADRIRAALEVTAFAGGWLLILLAFVTCFDVVCRKIGIEVPSPSCRSSSGTCTRRYSRCGWATTTRSTRIRASTRTPNASACAARRGSSSSAA